MNERDWYMCSKCFNQGWVQPNGIPNPNWGGGCKMEWIKGLTGQHDWQKMKYNGKTLYQNHQTDLAKYPSHYFEIK